MSLMKWATIVSKSNSHENTAKLATEGSNNSASSGNSKLVESEDILISPIHSPASSDNSDRGTNIYSVTPPEADMYDTCLQLFYSDDEDTIEVIENEQRAVDPLPFPKLSDEWYRCQHMKSNKNASRENMAV